MTDLFAERYRAIAARDRRFDGQFFTAVRTTGIYCRPSCPARTPRPENVTFYLTSAAAHEAGYRACRRCLPEAAPGTPAWNLRRDLAGRAMRLVADGVVDREGVPGLAARLGYTPRHLHRLLVAELGAGPLALARAQRAQTARALLAGTSLRLADVAFAAGFGSIRQFNDTVQQVFGVAPSALRSAVSRGAGRLGAARPIPGHAATCHPTGPGADPAAVGPVRLELRLPVREPFDAPGVFGFLAARAVVGVEASSQDDDGTLRYARTLALPHGPAAFEVTAAPSGPSGSGMRAAGRRPRAPSSSPSAPTPVRSRSWEVRVRAEVASLADVATLVTRVRRLLDLDADPVAVDAALGGDPLLAPLVAATPGIRVPGAADTHELVVRAIVGQQISVAAARTHLGRLATLLGTPYASSFPGLTTLFPSAAAIADGVPVATPGSPAASDPDRPLRLPARSVGAVVGATRALATGDLVVDVGADPDTLRAALVALPGVGAWTAAYVAMRVLGDPDAWLEGDVALLAGAAAAGVVPASRPTSPSGSTTVEPRSMSRSRASRDTSADARQPSSLPSGPASGPTVGPATTLAARPSASRRYRELADHAAGWAPWRSYAAMHLWRAQPTRTEEPR